ncbi:Heterogeneous nuclear ribonucleoprotein 1 [Heracleum sosnowskyi]|uniref:Heterogeneous nuclear ribonucleoprotein 1 n=1 Tax=Heracleum sosnowskyi TaxID=360622 RepID=A0AAD8I3K5_9APIA|nr:Heterogeneous nuclear ribonucleoprotein 1 [Heracleum sosnowskyi]
MEMEGGKLFIGGISWDTNEDRLKEYFETFGEVVEAVIMKDRTTGRARGFGFVVFADPAVAERVVKEKHMIDGRTVEAKKAVPRDDQQTPNRISGSVQGSPDVVVMYDHNTQRPRGFGFITFDSEEAVDRVLLRTFHELNGKMVEGYSPSPVGGYGLRMDGRFSPAAVGRSGYSSLTPGYGLGSNSEPGFGPNLEGAGHLGSNISYARNLNAFQNGSPNRYGSPIGHGIAGTGSVFNSMNRNTWGDGGLNYAKNLANSAEFMGSGQDRGIGSAFGTENISYSNAENNLDLGGVGYAWNVVQSMGTQLGVHPLLILTALEPLIMISAMQFLRLHLEMLLVMLVVIALLIEKIEESLPRKIIMSQR